MDLRKSMIIISRGSIFAESLCANLLADYHNCDIILTKNLISPTEELLTQITDKNVFIIGGYYTGNLKQFINVAKQVTVFYKNKDKVDESNHTIIKFPPSSGICNYTLQFIPDYIEKLPCLKKFFYNFDLYLNGSPSEEATNLQYGFYELEGNFDQKINLPDFINDTMYEHIISLGITVKNSNLFLMNEINNCTNFFDYKTYERIISLGMNKKMSNIISMNLRLESSEIYEFDGNKIRVAMGEAPVVDSCILLSEGNDKFPGTGIGMLVRYNSGKTFVTCAVTKESGKNACEIMKKFINGGGSHKIGGGSIDGILSIDKLFSRFDQQI